MSFQRSESASPRLSVVIPAYESHRTIGGALQALQEQSFRDFEVIVVDSSPDDRSEQIVLRDFPAVRYIRHPTRLFPHAARNRGVESSKGQFIVFTDPDIYAERDWLKRMVAAHARHGQVVVGAIGCHGHRLFDRGVHLCKFAKWLPGGAPRRVDMSPTGNMLVERALFDRAGAFPGGNFLGDVELSRALEREGAALIFEPQALVHHHHLVSWHSYLSERFTRGKIYGAMRARWWRSRRRVLAYLTATILPIRIARIALLISRDALRAGAFRWLPVLPIALIGQAASLAGEAVAYARSGLGRSPDQEPGLTAAELGRQRHTDSED